MPFEFSYFSIYSQDWAYRDLVYIQMFVHGFHSVILRKASSFKTEDVESPCDVMAKVLDSKIIVYEFELKLCYYIHFWTNTLEKGMNSSIPKALGYSVPLLFVYKGGFDINCTYQVSVLLFCTPSTYCCLMKQNVYNFICSDKFIFFPNTTDMYIVNRVLKILI